MSKELNLPITILHEMNGVQYRIGGNLIAVNESADTCTVRFNNGRVEKNISMSDVYINEGFIDKIKEYGNKFANWVVRKVKGLIAFVDGSGKFNINSYRNSINMVASYSSDETPSCAYFWPSDSLIAAARECGVNPKVPDFDEVFGAETEEEEYRMANEMLSRIMNRYATSDDTIEEACRYVNNKYYKTSALFESVFGKDTQSEHINERYGETPPTGVFSVESVPSNIFGIEPEGIVVGSKALRAAIEESIANQINLDVLEEIEGIKDEYRQNEDYKDYFENNPNPSDDEWRKDLFDDDDKDLFDDDIRQLRTNTERHPLLIWGAPGIGKTAIVKKVIKEMRENSITFPINLNIAYVQCANMDKDSVFLPDLERLKLTFGDNSSTSDTYVTMERTTAAAKCWLPVYQPTGSPETDEWYEAFFASSAHLIPQKEGGRYLKVRDENGKDYEGGVLFMDEIARMYSETQHTMMAIADGKLESSVIARSWAVICASNRVQDDPSQDISTTFQQAWNRRFVSVCYVPKFEEWLDWAKGVNSYGRGRIAPELVEFIESGGEKLWYSAVMYGAYDNFFSSPTFKEKFKKDQENNSNRSSSKKDYDKNAIFGNWKDINTYMSNNSTNKKDAMRFLYDAINNLPEDQNPLKNNRMSWTGADWEFITNEYEKLLRTILNKNPKGHKWGRLLKAAVKNGEKWVSQSELSKALNEIDDDVWIKFCENKLGDAYNSRAEKSRLDTIRLMIYKLIQKVMRAENALPAVEYKRYNEWRAVFNIPDIIEGIYENGLMPDIPNESDAQGRTYRTLDDIPARKGGLPWKSNPKRIEEAFDYIYTQYPGGKNAAISDFNKFVSDITDRVAILNNDVRNKSVSTTPEQKAKIMKALSDNFCGDKPYDESTLNNFLTVTADKKNYIIFDTSNMSDVAKKFLYYLITESKFFFHILNLVRYIIHTKMFTSIGPMENYKYQAKPNSNEKPPFANDIIQKMFMSDKGAENDYSFMQTSVARLFTNNQPNNSRIPIRDIDEICVICNMFDFMRRCFANADSTKMKSNGKAL